MELGKAMIKFIKLRDISGDPINFTIQKQTTPKTFIGGFISICLFSYLIVTFIYKLSDVIGKKNPTISFYTENQPNPLPMNLNLSNLPIAFAVRDVWGNFYNEEIVLNVMYLSNKISRWGNLL